MVVCVCVCWAGGGGGGGGHMEIVSQNEKLEKLKQSKAKGCVCGGGGGRSEYQLLHCDEGQILQRTNEGKKPCAAIVWQYLRLLACLYTYNRV